MRVSLPRCQSENRAGPRPVLRLGEFPIPLQCGPYRRLGDQAHYLYMQDHQSEAFSMAMSKPSVDG